jgi:hypothetical protein
MKRFVAVMTVGAVFTAICLPAAIAQAQKAAPAPAAPAVAAAVPTPAETRPVLRTNRQPWTRADARVCLEFPTNLQIIKCAEKYRYTRVPA